jgi:hypothetical protein
MHSSRLKLSPRGAALLGALTLASLGTSSCGTLPITDEYDAERLIHLPFETTWSAALKVASLRSGTIHELKSERKIKIDSDVDVEILLEPLTRNETRIQVRAIEAGGLKRDPDTARWVADGIYREAAQ